MVIPLSLIVTLSVELPTVTVPLLSVIVSALFSLIVIPPLLIVTLSVELHMTVVAAKVATGILASPSNTFIPFASTVAL